MKKKIYTTPILEELSVDDIQLLAGAGTNSVEAGDPKKDPDMPYDPNMPFAPEYQFNEVE